MSFLWKSSKRHINHQTQLNGIASMRNTSQITRRLSWKVRRSSRMLSWDSRRTRRRTPARLSMTEDFCPEEAESVQRRLGDLVRETPMAARSLSTGEAVPRLTMVQASCAKYDERRRRLPVSTAHCQGQHKHQMLSQNSARRLQLW